MNTKKWLTDPLAYILDPVSTNQFYEDYYEKKPLLSVNKDSERFEGLVTIERIDKLISDSELPPRSVQMARHEPTIYRDDFTFSNGNIDRGSVVRAYQEGATLILPQMHLSDGVLMDFCRALEKEFSCHVQTNIYLTPPSNQGFPSHYDNHDVFVAQVGGKKRWNIYEKPKSNPYRGEEFKRDIHAVGKSVQEFTMEAGDCLYIPRGWIHDAVSVDEEPSLHVTIGLITKTWADLMIEAISEVALREPDFRMSLPPHFAQANYQLADMEAYFQKLIKTFAAEADFSESFELFLQEFLRSRPAIVRGGIESANDEINREDEFMLRSSAQFLLRDTENECIAICGGGDLSFDLKARPALEKLILGDSISLADFSELSEEKSVDTIKRLSAFGLIVLKQI